MYPSDLSNNEWDLIKGYFARKDPRSCKSQHDKRTIVNAIFYLNKGSYILNGLYEGDLISFQGNRQHALVLHERKVLYRAVIRLKSKIAQGP